MCELPNKIAAMDEFNESNYNRLQIVKMFFWFVIVLLIFSSSLCAQQEIEQKNVLVLTSYSPTVPVADLWDKGIRSVFDASSVPPVKTDIEHLYHHRIQDHHYKKLLVDLYHYKYSKEKPDLIIAIYSAALDFAIKSGSDLFQDIPIVFGGIDRQSVENRKLGSNIYGITNSTSYKETLDLALTLHPNTRHVAIVAGVDFVSRQSLREARKIYRTYEKRITFIDLVGLPMAGIQKKVANLPPDTVVIFIMLLKDGDGNEFTAVEALSLISPASNAPIYSFQSHHFGYGMVGGYLSDVESNGKAVAELGLNVLKGAKPSNQPIVHISNYQLKFDWRQLRRWSIPEDRLPQDSIVEFKVVTVWNRYKGQIFAAITLILLQTLIIIYLLHQRQIRLRAEHTLKDRLIFEQMLSELSSEFTRISPMMADSKIFDSLSRVGAFMKADRGYLFRFNWDKTKFQITHLWEAEGIEKEQTVRGAIVRDIFPWLYENLIKGKDIIISDVAQLPGEAARSEHKYCLKIGIQSFLILPIQVENAQLCAIGLDAIRNERKWLQEDLDRLRLIGEIFANALERKYSEERAKANELKYRTVADYTYDWEYWSNMDGTLEYVSPSCKRISGYSVQDFKENPALFREIIVPEDKKSWYAHSLRSEEKLKPGEIQFRIQRKDGEIRWIEHVCQPVTDSQGTLLGLRASNRDISVRKQAELDAKRHRAELTHISRIATMGELSASLAHELNQPLTAILSNAQTARRFLAGDGIDVDEVNEILNDIIHDNKRAANMIKQLRALMQKKELEFTSLDLNIVLRGVAGLADREAFTKDATLVLDLADNIPPVHGDAIHLEQVALNLILNGAEAMETIDSQSRELRILTAKHDDNTVRVSVRDQGTGIDETHIDGIFEAFYTTKTEGMGMGLSICRSIIEAHGGRLWAENNPDKGATISFTVPVSRD